MERIWLKSYPAGVPAEIEVDALGSIADYFDAAVARYRVRKAFISGSTGVAVTYRELDRLSRCVAAWFQSVLLLPRGTRVALMMPTLTADLLVAHCRANLTGYKVPREVEFLADLPKSNVGQILRRELRDRP